MNEWIITTAITLGIGAITYFLKRTMNQVDNHGKEIQQLNMEVVKEHQTDPRRLHSQKRTRKRF